MTDNPKHGMLPEGWEWRELGDVCKINPPKREVSILPGDLEVTFLPMPSVSYDGEIIERETRTLGEVRKGYTYFKDGDVLFAKITPCMENGKGAIAENLKNGIGFGSTEFHILRPKSEVLTEWIFRLISHKPFRKHAEQNMTGTAGQKRVPKDFLDTYKIPLPPLETQRKIVEILERADVVRRKRQEADKKTAQILQAAFVKMFGDPVRNEGGWDIAKMGDIVKSCRYGPRFYNQPYSTEGVPILRTTDISESGEISFETAPLMEVSSEEIQKYRLEKGDIVITRSGTLGRCALFDRDDFDCIPGAFLIQFRFSDRVLPIYMKHYIMSHFVQSMIKSMGRTVAQPNINANELKSIKVPISPLELQRKFARLVESVEAMRGRQTVSKDHIGEMFKGLMQKAFGGELVA